MPESLPIHNKFLPDVYRYAFLMTGSVATAMEVLRTAVEGAARGLSDDDRKPGYAKRWLFARARELCRSPHLLRPAPASTVDPGAMNGSAPAPGGDGATTSVVVAAPGEVALPAVPAADDAANAPNRLAALFAVLPEKERSALILFYLYRLNPAELAEIVEVKPGELGPLLKQARGLLQQQKAERWSLPTQLPAVPVSVASE